MPRIWKIVAPLLPVEILKADLDLSDRYLAERTCIELLLVDEYFCKKK